MKAYQLGISPRALARIAGVLYLINIVLGAYGELGIRQQILAPDAATTATNLHAMESLWRWGIASELVLLLSGVPLAVILYVLLRQVHRPLTLLAVAFCVIGIAIEAAMVMYLLEALFPLGSDAYLQAFTRGQLDAMASVALKAHNYGFGVSLLFFACYQITIGVVIFKSGYMPRLVGVLMLLGGAGYLVNNFALILHPSTTSWLFPVTAVPALLGELSLCLFLLVKGVNVARYQERLALRAA
jgi:Domain of unknown function (DUF4386)